MRIDKFFTQFIVISWFTIKALWIGVPVLGIFLFLNEIFISDTRNYGEVINTGMILSSAFSYPLGHPFGTIILEYVYNFDIVREPVQSVSRYYFQDSSIAINIVGWIVMFLVGYIQWFMLAPYFAHKIYCCVNRLRPLQVAHHTFRQISAKREHRHRTP